MMKASRFLATDMMEALKMLMSAGQSVFFVVRPSYDKKNKKFFLIIVCTLQFHIYFQPCSNTNFYQIHFQTKKFAVFLGFN